MKKKPKITLYTTNDPSFEGRRWLWFDHAFWKEFPPKVGNLPTATFDKLRGGILIGRLREYSSKEAAVADLLQTGDVRVIPGPPKVRRKDWIEPVNLEFIRPSRKVVRV